MAREEGTLDASITTIFTEEEIRSALNSAIEDGYGTVEKEDAYLNVDEGALFPGWFVFTGGAIEVDDKEILVEGPTEWDESHTVLSDLEGGLEQTKRLQRAVNEHENFVDLTEPQFNEVESQQGNVEFDFSLQYRE